MYYLNDKSNLSRNFCNFPVLQYIGGGGASVKLHGYRWVAGKVDWLFVWGYFVPNFGCASNVMARGDQHELQNLKQIV